MLLRQNPEMWDRRKEYLGEGLLANPLFLILTFLPLILKSLNQVYVYDCPNNHTKLSYGIRALESLLHSLKHQPTKLVCRMEIA